MNQFKNLLVWQKSVDMAVEIYKITKKFPGDERFGLISQINRCAVSVASNIAEGAGRNSNNEFHHFLGISVGSLFELETQLIIANKLDYLSQETLLMIVTSINEIQNMTFGLIKSLNNNK
jgi:four helix bundle protein